MMNKLRAPFVIVMVALGLTTAAQEAVFSALIGKVAYQVPGASAWEPASIGDHVSAGTMVSTGLKSSAVLKIGQSTITLKAITRLTLEELIRTEGGTQTRLFLLAGRVRAEVPPQAQQTTEFTVKSPTAVASVRGTGFFFDGSNLLVDSGTVRLSTPTSQFRMVRIGEYSAVVRGSPVLVPIAVVMPAAVAKGSEEGTVTGEAAGGTDGGTVTDEAGTVAGEATLAGEAPVAGGFGTTFGDIVQQVTSLSLVQVLSAKMEAPALPAPPEISGNDSSVTAQ